MKLESNNKISTIYLPVFLSSAISFLFWGVAHLVYSKVLTVDEFGLYASSLAVGAVGNMLFENSIKNALLKYSEELNKDIINVFFLIHFGLSLTVITFAIVAIWIMEYNNLMFSENVRFVLTLSAVYWITSAFITIPTAILEKRLSYQKISWIESVYFILDRCLPALLLLVQHSMSVFIIATVISRFFRILVLNRYVLAFQYQNVFEHNKRNTLEAMGIVKSSLKIFLGNSSSLIRDNLHILIIGPLYGQSWVGYYAFGLVLCSMSSQIIIQVSSRLTASMTRNMDNYEEKKQYILTQVNYLAGLIIPILPVFYFVIVWLNQSFFENKWTNTILILPLLFLRMIMGVITTPVGTFLMVNKSGNQFILVNWYWTVAEIIFALIAAYFLGQTGLAWSYAMVVWVGAYLLCLKTDISIKDIVKLSLNRNSFYYVLLLFLLFIFISHRLDIPNVYFLLLSILLMILSFWNEPFIHHFFISWQKELKSAS